MTSEDKKLFMECMTKPEVGMVLTSAKDHDNCDVYYLNSGRVVRFFNTL